MAPDRLWTIVRMRVRSLLKGRVLDAELDEELRYHVDRQTEELVSRGASPDEARTLALRAMGGIERRKEEMRDQRGVAFIENVARDLRFGLRQLWRQPGFAVTVILGSPRLDILDRYHWREQFLALNSQFLAATAGTFFWYSKD